MGISRVPTPPVSFDPAVCVIDANVVLYRVHSLRYGPTQMNPGTDVMTQAARQGAVFPVHRFSFFLDDSAEPTPVQVLYGAATSQAAIWETVLRDRHPDDKSKVPPTHYEHRMLSCIRPSRELRLASLAGADMSRFELPQDALISPEAGEYEQTIPWARAAWAAGFDGLRYVSRQDTSSLAYVFFGRSDESDQMFTHAPEEEPDRYFGDYGAGFEWLTETVSRWRLKLAF